jgi:hypothetical protein
MCVTSLLSESERKEKEKRKKKRKSEGGARTNRFGQHIYITVLQH